MKKEDAEALVSMISELIDAKITKRRESFLSIDVRRSALDTERRLRKQVAELLERT